MTSLRRAQDVTKGQTQSVGRTRTLDLNIRPYGDVLITSAKDVLKTPIGDVP